MGGTNHIPCNRILLNYYYNLDDSPKNYKKKNPISKGYKIYNHIIGNGALRKGVGKMDMALK